MFTLRIIEETRKTENDPFDQVIRNIDIGDLYVVYHRGRTGEFDEIMKTKFPDCVKHKEIKAIMLTGNKAEILLWEHSPLIRHWYYIMTESGKTFEKL